MSHVALAALGVQPRRSLDRATQFPRASLLGATFAHDSMLSKRLAWARERSDMQTRAAIPRTQGCRKRIGLRWAGVLSTVTSTTSIPVFEALAAGAMDVQGGVRPSKRRTIHGVFFNRAPSDVELRISSWTAMGGDKFGAHISSVIAFNGKHGGDIDTRRFSLRLACWC